MFRRKVAILLHSKVAFLLPFKMVIRSHSEVIILFHYKMGIQ